MRAFQNASSRSACTSIVALIAALALVVAVFFPRRWHGQSRSSPQSETRHGVDEILAALPHDPRLTEPLASRWTKVAGDITRAEGAEGLKTLELYGPEAADLFVENPLGFHQLTAITSLDRTLLEVSTGPWREAVLEWARAGQLTPYLDHLACLNADQRVLLTATPGCLPLLGRGAPTAEAMLSRYGGRAWRLFLGVDFADDVEGVERVARSLVTYGDRMLRVNESHGPAISLLFVPPREDASGRMPLLFSQAVDRLDVEDAGALFLANYDDLMRLILGEGHASEEVVEAVDLLAGQPEEVRALASDSGRVVRLLLERRGREPVGVEILARCGPEAADLLFEDGGYAGHGQEKAAALAILARRGWPGVELLRRFRDDESWHRLLRRIDLLDSDDEPLIVRLAGKLETSTSRQDEIERYLAMPREQIVGLDLPITLTEEALEWVPGYLAGRTAYQAARGYRIETSEVAMALFDGVTTVTFVGKLVGRAIKTVGKQVPKVAFRNLEGQVIDELTAKRKLEATKLLMTRLPGVLRLMTPELPAHLPTLDITSVARTASAITKKLGLRTWGKLDRRIIVRGDRKVIIDLSDPKVISQVGQQIKDDVMGKMREEAIGMLCWEAIADKVGVLGPCLMEQVHPDLRAKIDESRLPATEKAPSPSPKLAAPGVTPAQLSDHPAFTTVGSAMIVACLVLAVPWARETMTRRLCLRPKPQPDRLRRYQE